ncbi:MAG: VOC family protein [Pseudorhodobacter sp.]
MLLYTTVGTNDLPRAVAFYDAIFDVLGHARLPDWADGWAAWGEDYDAGFSFCLCPAFDGQAATPGNGTMFAFRAKSAAEVRQIHAAGLAHGGEDAGAPGTRVDYGPAFFVAYLRDPDGNKLAAVFHRHDPALEG